MPDIVWIWKNASVQGKKPLRIELYLAHQWRHNWNPHKRTIHPHPPFHDRDYWTKYYRMRVNGRWRRGHKCYKYSFYTLEEALMLVDKFLT